MPKETLDFGPPGKKRRVAGGLQGIAAANPGWLEQSAGWIAPRGGGWGGGEDWLAELSPTQKMTNGKELFSHGKNGKRGKTPKCPFPLFSFFFPPLPPFLTFLLLLYYYFGFWSIAHLPS